MEKYRKCGKSSKLDIEVDDEESESENENMGVGRSYECNYCKRGFTNAQALGGHMNIHRKDKAKARHQQLHRHASIFSSSSSSNSYMPVVMDPPISAYNSSSFRLAPPAPPPRTYPQGGYYPFFNNPSVSSQPSIFDGNRTRLFGMYEDHRFGADLSLRISSSSGRSIDQNRQGDRPTPNNSNEEEDRYNDIDLELRLGYDPQAR